MKKILVMACLLSIGLSANDDFYPDGDIQTYLKIEKGIYPKRACDEPQSQACKIETKKICGDDKECLDSYAQLHNTERDRFEADRSVGYFLNHSLQKQYNQENFKKFLQTAKSLGWSKEEVLNMSFDYRNDGSSLLEIIKNKKLKSQLQDIKQVFNSK